MVHECFPFSYKELVCDFDFQGVAPMDTEENCIRASLEWSKKDEEDEVMKTEEETTHCCDVQECKVKQV